MDRKEVIRERILSLGVDVCGFGGVERFAEAPINFRPIDLYPDCKSVIAVGIALPKGLFRVESRLIYGHFNADVVHKVMKSYSLQQKSLRKNMVEYVCRFRRIILMNIGKRKP